MKPYIFISSTIKDLHHLRDAIRGLIFELGYSPVMSDYGDIPFFPWDNATDSCFDKIKKCHLAILIIGKRYGTLVKNTDLSVTHLEFQTAYQEKVPVLCLVERDVLSYKEVYKENPEKHNNFPGMENSEKTFSFIDEICDKDRDNAIFPFTNVSEARDIIKNQLAMYFASLLNSKKEEGSPLKERVDEILSVVKGLQEKIIPEKDEKNHDTLKQMKAMRILLDNKYNDFRLLAEGVCGGLDKAITSIVSCKTFDDFLKTSKANLHLSDDAFSRENLKAKEPIHFQIRMINPTSRSMWFLCPEKEIYMNNIAKNYLTDLYLNLQKRIAG